MNELQVRRRIGVPNRPNGMTPRYDNRKPP